MKQREVEELNSDPLVFDLSNFTSGVYTLTIKMKNNKPITKLFIVSNL